MTGREGVANFLSYGILSGLTSYFLLYPYNPYLNYHEIRGFSVFASIAFVVFVMTYYVLGDGKFGRDILKGTKIGRKVLGLLTRRTKPIQVWVYRLTFVALGVYLYFAWF